MTVLCRVFGLHIVSLVGIFSSQIAVAMSNVVLDPVQIEDISIKVRPMCFGMCAVVEEDQPPPGRKTRPSHRLDSCRFWTARPVLLKFPRPL
jgi:hypothetical protein